MNIFTSGLEFQMQTEPTNIRTLVKLVFFTTCTPFLRLAVAKQCFSGYFLSLNIVEQKVDSTMPLGNFYH